MAYFICPSCAHREPGGAMVVGQPRACVRCGFGFLFEILEDYDAGPRTALVVCDAERRIVTASGTASAVTGYEERDLVGHEVIERLGLGGWDGEDPAAKSLEWGVRVLGVRCTFRPNGLEADRPATADFFPGYDDGGLMVALTPN